MKKLNHMLNIIIGAFAGAFIGGSLYVVWHFKMHPEIYASYSAPWYTQLLVDGVFTLLVILICFVVKIILKAYQKKQETDTNIPS